MGQGHRRSRNNEKKEHKWSADIAPFFLLSDLPREANSTCHQGGGGTATLPPHTMDWINWTMGHSKPFYALHCFYSDIWPQQWEKSLKCLQYNQVDHRKKEGHQEFRVEKSRVEKSYRKYVLQKANDLKGYNWKSIFVSWDRILLCKPGWPQSHGTLAFQLHSDHRYVTLPRTGTVSLRRDDHLDYLEWTMRTDGNCIFGVDGLPEQTESMGQPSWAANFRNAMVSLNIQEEDGA